MTPAEQRNLVYQPGFYTKEDKPAHDHTSVMPKLQAALQEAERMRTVAELLQRADPAPLSVDQPEADEELTFTDIQTAVAIKAEALTHTADTLAAGVKALEALRRPPEQQVTLADPSMASVPVAPERSRLAVRADRVLPAVEMNLGWRMAPRWVPLERVSEEYVASVQRNVINQTMFQTIRDEVLESRKSQFYMKGDSICIHYSPDTPPLVISLHDAATDPDTADVDVDMSSSIIDEDAAPALTLRVSSGPTVPADLVLYLVSASMRPVMAQKDAATMCRGLGIDIKPASMVDAVFSGARTSHVSHALADLLTAAGMPATCTLTIDGTEVSGTVGYTVTGGRGGEVGVTGAGASISGRDKVFNAQALLGVLAGLDAVTAEERKGVLEALFGPGG